MHYEVWSNKTVEDTIGSPPRKNHLSYYFIGLSETDIDSLMIPPNGTDAARPLGVVDRRHTSRSLRRSFITSVVRKDR
jgi:hypothetical protein